MSVVVVIMVILIKDVEFINVGLKISKYLFVYISIINNENILN